MLRSPQGDDVTACSGLVLPVMSPIKGGVFARPVGADHGAQFGSAIWIDSVVDRPLNPSKDFDTPARLR